MDLRRHLADALSAANAACGVASTCFALAGRADVSLLQLLAGAVCDGLDGAAARRFGGTRFGVLADDVADAISYAIAPAVAVAVVTAGVEGTVIGVVYGALTIARLVFFTLKKGAPDTDPGVFRGLPSTVGGVFVIAAAILAPHQPALVAFAAGMAVVLMVSFDAGFVHLGRSLAELDPRRRRVVLAVAAVTVVSAAVLGPHVLASAALATAVAYAFTPHLQSFATAIQQRQQAAPSAGP